MGRRYISVIAHKIAVSSSSRPKFVYLTALVAILEGAAFSVLTPPFQFNDEHAHFARANQISRGELFGNRPPRLPGVVLSTLLRYPEGLEPQSAPRISLADVFAHGAGENSPPEPTANDSQLRYLGLGNLSYEIYSPFCYLPAAVGIRIVRILDLLPLAMLYAARLMNVLSFSVALAIALLLLPNFRGLYTAVGLMPMTLHQAAAVSADPVMIGLSMTGFARVLRAREHPVSRRYLGVLLVTLPVWVLCKNSVWALPVLLLIPTERFGTTRKRVAYLLAATVLALAAVVLWRHLTRDAFEDYRVAELSRGIDVYANIASLPIIR
jgi:hypothetical protein